jgi:hypothetical protein
MRSAGTVHTLSFRSISGHLAPSTSRERLAFKMVNSSAMLATASRSRRAATKAGTSE